MVSASEHLSFTDLSSYVSGHLSVEESLRIDRHLRTCPTCASLVSGAVLACRDIATWRGTPSPNDRRSEPRFPAGSSGVLQALNPLCFERIPITVLNMSSHGAKLRSHLPYEIGTMIRIRLQEAFIIGEVRYCIHTDDQFHIGISMLDVCVQKSATAGSGQQSS